MTLDEQIAILQAAKEGKTIERQCIEAYLPSWGVIDGTAPFNFQDYSYRIKREPREWWLVGCYVFGDRTEAEKHRFNASNKSGDILLVREVIE